MTYWYKWGHGISGIRTADGLPIGMQVSRAHFDEYTFIALAQAFEQAIEWHKRWPAILQLSTQFSSLRPGTRLNSRMLFVTSVALACRACAAIKRSIGCPQRGRRLPVCLADVPCVQPTLLSPRGARHDCRDAGDRATHGAVAEGIGRPAGRESVESGAGA